MKKRLLSAFTLVALVMQLLGCLPASAAAPTKIPKFLILGNSFAVDAMKSYFRAILKAEGVTEYTIAYLYYAGGTVAEHASFAENDLEVYTFHKATASSNWSETRSTMRTALQDEEWDYVFLQQGSKECADANSYNGDIDYLMKYVKENATNPNVKFGWHMTWAFSKDLQEATSSMGATTRPKIFESFGRDSQKMYQAIADAVQSKVLTRNFSIVIPSGTAVENARASQIGDTMQTADGYHLDTKGDLIASYCWYAALTGTTLDSLKYVPSSLGLSKTEQKLIVEAVNNACKTPYAVTPSAYLPTKAITLAGGGQAEVNGEKVTEAPKDTTVTLRYSNTNKCTQFNGWEVREGNVTLADLSNPVTSFFMPDEAVSIRAKVTNNCPSLRMTDVSSTAWYHNAVDYALENGIMSGYSKTSFGTNDTLTRAQVVQVLYNKEGKPAVTAENQFTDVPADQWFFDAVRWAADKGVVSGVGDGQFNPNGKITLEQAAVILHNYSGKPSASAELNAIGNYSSWAADALRWCVANDLLKDIPFENATDAATRAQTAQILYNYLTK